MDKKPTKASDVLIKKLLDVSKKKVAQTRENFDKIIQVFELAGGSWMGLFLGSPEDMHLLKKVIKVGYKKKFLTRKEKPL